MAALKIVSPPASEPIDVTTMKNVLKLPAAIVNDDGYIAELIQAAREQCEKFTSRSLVNKGYRQSLDSFPYYTDSILSQMAYPPAYYSLPRYSTTLWNYSQMIKLMRSPLRQVTKIAYVDSGTGTTKALFPSLPAWLPLNEQSIGDQIQDSNGNLQVVSAVSEGDEDSTSITGATAPAWATLTGHTTNDGMIVWVCMGPAPAANFVVDADSEPPRIFPLPGQFWPSVLYVPNAVQIYFTAGYGTDGSAVPAGIKTAMRQLVTDWYYNREPISAANVHELPNHIKALIWSNRVLDLAPTRG